jgi:DNA mismatch repair ATPase MutS
MAVIREAEARPILALVDEILVGTNSEDRIQASIRILRRLGSGGSMAIAATHDLAIAEALKDDCGLYHFSERIGAGDLVFDYVIKPGVVDKRNAFAILRHLGFPGELLGLDDEDSGAS